MSPEIKMMWNDAGFPFFPENDYFIEIDQNDNKQNLIESQTRMVNIEPEYSKEDLVALEKKFPIVEIRSKTDDGKLMVYTEENTIFDNRSVFVNQPIKVIKLQFDSEMSGTFINGFVTEKESGQKYPAYILLEETTLELRGKEHKIEKGTVFGLISPAATFEEKIIKSQ